MTKNIASWNDLALETDYSPILWFDMTFLAHEWQCLSNLIEMRIPSEINPPLTSSIPWGALGFPVTFCPFQAALLTFKLIREVGKEVPNWFRLMAKNWYLVSVSNPVIRVSIQGVKSLWGDCVVFPRLGTGDTDRWRINKGLFATC